MRGLAEALPDVFRAFRRRVVRSWPDHWQSPEAIALLNRWIQDAGHVPPLPELAALLDRVHLGFGGLERIQLSLDTGERYFIGPPEIPATLLVERLDLGLRALRLERGLTQAETAIVAGLKPMDLSAVEDIGRREKPPLAVLDRLLQALDASYEELENAVARPLGVAGRRERRLRDAERRAEPVSVGGRVLPPVVAERLDLALRSLRLKAGLSLLALSKASGVPPERILGFEDPARRSHPAESELDAILRALALGPEALQQAARSPLHGLGVRASKRRASRRARRRRLRPARPQAAGRPALVSAALRIEDLIAELRRPLEPAAAPPTEVSGESVGLGQESVVDDR
jgi:transcriptional regulator with XRE-family HTH domain